MFFWRKKERRPGRSYSDLMLHFKQGGERSRGRRKIPRICKGGRNEKKFLMALGKGGGVTLIRRREVILFVRKEKRADIIQGLVETMVI